MAKAKINGTVYTITGGKVKINGTIYTIASGKALVNGNIKNLPLVATTSNEEGD